MAQQEINVGAAPNDGTGDPLRTAYIKTNNNFTELDYLKIDTEGSDCKIMQHLADFLKTEPATRYPKKILFESNELANQGQVEYVKAEFIKLGYCVAKSGYDTVLEYKKSH